MGNLNDHEKSSDKHQSQHGHKHSSPHKPSQEIEALFKVRIISVLPKNCLSELNKNKTMSFAFSKEIKSRNSNEINLKILQVNHFIMLVWHDLV